MSSGARHVNSCQTIRFSFVFEVHVHKAYPHLAWTFRKDPSHLPTGAHCSPRMSTRRRALCRRRAWGHPCEQSWAHPAPAHVAPAVLETRHVNVGRRMLPYPRMSGGHREFKVFLMPICPKDCSHCRKSCFNGRAAVGAVPL